MTEAKELEKQATAKSGASPSSTPAVRRNAKRKKPKKIEREIENINVEQNLPGGGYIKMSIASLKISITTK